MLYRHDIPGPPTIRSVTPQDGVDGSWRTARLDRLLREIGEVQEVEAERIAAAMYAAYRVEIPKYARISDQALEDDIRSVSAAAVRLWLSFMASGEPMTAEALQPIREGGRRRAAQGIELHAVLRAYRVGVRVMWRELVSAPAWNTPTLKNAGVHVAEWALDFSDRITTEVMSGYLEESARVTREREHRRSALLNVILSGQDDEAAPPSPQLAAPHVVVVAEVLKELTLAQLEQIGTMLERQFDGALWTVRSHSVVAAVPLGGGADRDHLGTRLTALLPHGDVVCFGVGGAARDAGETRQSYIEAVDALTAGRTLSGAAPGVCDYLEFAALLPLLREPGAAERFVSAALQPLQGVAGRPWALPTIEAHLVHRGHLKQIARHLGVHENTVKYRLREVREAVGSASLDGERASTLLLALRLRRILRAQHPEGGASARRQ